MTTFVHALLHSQSKNTHRGAGKAMAAIHGAEYHSSYDASTKKQPHTVHVFKAKSPGHAEEMKKKLEKHQEVNHAHISSEHGHILKEEAESTSKMKTFEEFLNEGVEVTGHREYEFTHGKKPDGAGNWMIGVGHKDINHKEHKEGQHFVSHNGKLSDAVKKAKAAAKQHGKSFVHILT